MTADACANNNYKRHFEKDVLKRRYKESVKRASVPTYFLASAVAGFSSAFGSGCSFLCSSGAW
jgi:hypothetical protein